MLESSKLGVAPMLPVACMPRSQKLISIQPPETANRGNIHHVAPSSTSATGMIRELRDTRFVTVGRSPVGVEFVTL